MTPQDMRRKGSWAVDLTDASNFLRWSMAGENRRGMRCQLMPGASLFPEPSPPRLAAKGERLLERYRRIKQKT